MGRRNRSIYYRLAARWTGRVLGGRATKCIREITEPLISCAATEELPVPAGISQIHLHVAASSAQHDKWA